MDTMSIYRYIFSIYNGLFGLLLETKYSLELIIFYT